MNRKPNCSCDKCGKSIYRRPYEMEIAKQPYRCSICKGWGQPLDEKICLGCNNLFKPRRKNASYCCQRCAASAKRGTRRINYPCQNKSLRNLKILKDTFGFKSCMIEGCKYDKCFEVHRFIPGKDSGKYELGNMFAICPNHHAEITRKIIVVEKISDCLLKIVEIK